MSQGRQIALDSASRGWDVFPVAVSYLPGGKSEKRPMVRWTEEATSDRRQIDEWWDRNPEAKCGIRTGCTTGLYVVDVDDVAVDTSGSLGLGIPVPTNRPGGVHYYFSRPVDVQPVPCSAGDGVDVRGEGGFVVGWNVYPVDAVESPLPLDIAGWARSRVASYGATERDPDSFEEIRWPGGGCDAWVVHMVGAMRRAGWRPEAALGALLAENEAGRFTPPCDLDWLAGKVRHVYDSYAGRQHAGQKLLEAVYKSRQTA